MAKVAIVHYSATGTNNETLQTELPRGRERTAPRRDPAPPRRIRWLARVAPRIRPGTRRQGVRLTA